MECHAPRSSGGVFPLYLGNYGVLYTVRHTVARWLVCHWGGKYTDCRPPPPPPPLPHAHTHAAFLSEFLISLQGRIQDFGEEGVGSTWIIDASTTGRGARAHENFCGVFSIDCIGN